MNYVEIKLPAMGEGITDATITRWLVNEGDTIEVDTPLVEVATDKVDSEIPSSVVGKVAKLLLKEGDIPKVGQVLAVIEVEEVKPELNLNANTPKAASNSARNVLETIVHEEAIAVEKLPTHLENGTFIPPLVRRIAKEEGITLNQLQGIKGSGIEGKLTKADILKYIDKDKGNGLADQKDDSLQSHESSGVSIIEMDRMRKLISAHMTHSKLTSAHVTSFIEVDMTNIMHWRDKNKVTFEKQYGEKITFTPFFIAAAASALKAYPLLNSSVIADQIHLKRDINIGMATALPDDNLIVPVIRNADKLNLAGLAGEVNDKAKRARASKLQPHEIQGGTFTITNLGAFDNLAGTPIINQPQVAILAVGTIKKRPVVIESPLGDTIGIRQIAILSLSYDHRIIDGALGGSFLKRIAANLENFQLKDL